MGFKVEDWRLGFRVSLFGDARQDPHRALDKVCPSVLVLCAGVTTRSIPIVSIVVPFWGYLIGSKKELQWRL